MFTDDFKRLLVDLVMGDMLMALRLATKLWKRVVDAFIDEGVESGAIIVRGSKAVAWPDDARKERLRLVTRVIFILNIRRSESLNACGPSILSLLISQRVLRASVKMPSTNAAV
ncbi:hypothetical protein TrLO_g2670 [Triparma laevis f. longispina]|uniref:Uncharacterized protein n=1 Tax=Triparma laevis f. longispina TaxID=1714387 RepID=A0A9W7AR52_9STRA|nr:hypothetical protein TrLO_g2670 [Triparma laevis f. longispina]